MLNCLEILFFEDAKNFHRLKKIDRVIAWECRRRDQRERSKIISLSRVPSIETITFTLETSVERWRIVATWKSCRRDQRKSRVWWRGVGKRWSTGNRARWRLHSACEIAGIPLWRVTPNSRGICRGSRGWERLGAQLFIELCLDVRRSGQLAPFSSPRV